MDFVGEYTLPLIILFLVAFFFWFNSRRHELESPSDVEFLTLSGSSSKEKNVAYFTINVHIPDLPDKFYEGGFYLYFDSPELVFKKLMAYRFDTGSTVSCKVNLQGRMINLPRLNEYLKSASIYSKSHNVFNTDMVTIVGVLEDGTTFSGMIEVNSQLDRNVDHNPITLESMNLTTN